MARNIERDRREAERRKKQIIEAGFRLFSKEGIENVTLQRVADEADVGIATLYKYFLTKERLVIAISRSIWGDAWQKVLERQGSAGFDKFTAYQSIRLYTDEIIRIYRENPEFLRFSGEYKTFVNKVEVDREQLKEHLDVLEPIGILFHRMYEKAKIDHSIRTDIPEQQMFTTVIITMLSIAERYAQGIVWAASDREDYTQELIYLQEMILAWCAGDGAKMC